MAQFRKKNSIVSTFKDNIPIFWIIISLILSISLAIGFRLLFSPARMNQLITSFEEANPKMKITVHDTKVSLASGLLPEFALVFKDGSVEINQDCDGLYLIEFKNLKIPIRLDSIFYQKIRLGYLQAEDLSLEKKPRKASCVSEKQLEVSVGNQALPEIKESKSSNESIGRLKSIPLSGVEFKKLKLKLDSSEEKIIEIKNLEVKKISDKEAKGDAVLHVDSKYTFGETLPDLHIDLHLVGEDLNVILQGKIREGQVLLNFNQNIKTNQKQVDVHLKQLPLGVVEKMLKNAKLVPEHWKPKSLWISGDASTQLNEKKDIKFENIELEGEFGNLTLSTFNYSIQNKVVTPFDIKLDKISIKEIYQLIQAPPPTGVFSELGYLKGSCNVLTLEDVKCFFAISDMQLIFRKEGMQKNQEVKSASLAGEFKNNKVVLQISKIDLKDGLAEGFANYNYNLNNYDAYAYYQFDKIKFNPDIESLWFGGKISEITSKGNIHSKGSEIQNAKGSIELKSLIADSYELSNLKINNLWSSGEWRLETTAQEVKIKKEHFLFSSFQELSDTSFASDRYDLTLNHAKIFLSKFGLEWRAAGFKMGSTVFTTEGRYDDGRFSGLIKTSNLRAKKAWSLSGDKTQLLIRKLQRDL